MNKILIKVIKRKDAEALANAETQSMCELKQPAPVSEETIERRSRRVLVDAISNWIPDRKKNNRIAEVAAVRKFFGSELLLREI